MILAFTGTQKVTPAVKKSVNLFFENLEAKYHRYIFLGYQPAKCGYPECNRSQMKHLRRPLLITGACIGVDELVATIGKMKGYSTYTVVPANKSKIDQEFRSKCFAFEIMPENSTYRDRNRRMVDICSKLIAFPAFPERHANSVRSGTWMTVRIARKLGKEVRVY